MHTDIGEHELALHALEVSERQYRRLFESARDGILILDADTGKIVDANPFLAELTGYSRDAFLGKHLWEIGPFMDIAASMAAFEKLRAAEYVRYEDLPLEDCDGRKIHVEFISNVYRVGNQNVIQCNIRDITDRKLAEEQIRSQLEELQRWQDIMLNREDRVQKLKREVNDLCSRCGEAARYSSEETFPADASDEKRNP
jgi:PAS domain S-box-containing protein